MLVSCLMPTYNKAPDSLWLVEEAIECFLRQDYADKELIIVNDTPGQTLRLAEPLPNVLLVNLPRRANTLGEKRNIVAALARGDVLFCWDDDDISLDWRISLSLERLGDADYWQPTNSLASINAQDERPKFDVVDVYAAGCFRRYAFVKAGGYPFTNMYEDSILRDRMPNVRRTALAPQERFYWYRWGTGSHHVSGLGADGYDDAGRQTIAQGVFVLRPHWRRDYVELLKGVVA